MICSSSTVYGRIPLLAALVVVGYHTPSLLVVADAASASSCYGEGRLLDLIDDVKAAYGGGRFVVCPGTTLIGFQYGDILTLKHEGTLLLCGEDGSRANNCTFAGGRGSIGPDQMYVWTRPDETPGGVQIKGFTMENAPNEAVKAIGPATFVDCLFRNNGGTSQYSKTPQVLVEPSFPPKAVIFRRCEFVNTKPGGRGGVQSLGGDLVLDWCTFEGADGTSGARVTGPRTRSGIGSLKVRNSCFENNKPYAVTLDPTIPLLENKENYGANNGPLCNGIKIIEGGISTCEAFLPQRCLAEGERSPSPERAKTVGKCLKAIKKQCQCTSKRRALNKCTVAAAKRKCKLNRQGLRRVKNRFRQSCGFKHNVLSRRE